MFIEFREELDGNIINKLLADKKIYLAVLDFNLRAKWT